MADLAREIGSRIRTQAVAGRDVAWVDTLDPLTVTLHGTVQAATNLSGQRLAVGDRVLVQPAGGAVIITHLHETRPQSGTVVSVSEDGSVIDAGGHLIHDVPVVADHGDALADLADDLEQAQQETADAIEQVTTDLATISSEAITQAVVEYAVSASATVPPESGWSTATPIRTPGTYVWMRTLITYGDQSQTVTSPALVTGNDGAKGDDGTSVTIQGSVASAAALPVGLGPGDAGKGWLTDDDGHLHVWSGTAWVDAGEIRGPQGAPGAQGPSGVGVATITVWYRLTSGAAPAQPTALTPSGWSQTEPGFVDGQVLWKTERITYTNGTHSWTPVTQSSAYAAAVHVGNLAEAATKGLVVASSSAPDHYEGRLWLVLDGNGRTTGIRRSNGSVWQSYALMADQVLVPGTVGDVSIGDGAVTAVKVQADESFADLVAGLHADFGTAFIGALTAEMIRSDSWIGQLLAGVNVKISDDPDDPLAEHIMLANLAMRIMRGDGDGGLYEATSLGGAGLDQLSMRPSASGSPRVVISGDGNASFAGHASVGTLAVGGELLSERLARLPQGIMADFPVSGAAIPSWGNTNYGLVRLSWQMQAGRRYKLSMKLNLQGPEGDSYWLTIRTTRGTSTPTVGTPIHAQDYGTIAPNAAVGSTNHDTHEHEFTIMDTYNGTFNALVVIRTWNANREMRLRSGADYVSRFTLEDMGFVDGAAVTVDPAGGNPFTGTAPAPAPQPTPRKQTLHRTSWRSFRNGSTYSGASELEHGTYNGIVRRGQLLFPAVPSGATNIRAKLRIRATHTWAGSGATFYIGIGTESSLQTSVPGHSAGAQHHFARGEEREIPLPGWTTSHRSVWLGIGAPGTTASYGRFDPSSAYIVYEYDLA